MKNLHNKQLAKTLESPSFENDFFVRNLKGNSFRGFWYDDNEKSYGIALHFDESDCNILNLYAQDNRFGSILSEYNVESRSIILDQIAYDKILITIDVFHSKVLNNPNENVSFPQSIEFTLQLLSRNSVYLQFVNHKQFSPPINKLRFGLVMAKEA